MKIWRTFENLPKIERKNNLTKLLLYTSNIKINKYIYKIYDLIYSKLILNLK